MLRNFLLTLPLILVLAATALTQLSFNRNGQFDRTFGSSGFAEMGIGLYSDIAAFADDGSIVTVHERRTSQSGVMSIYVYKQLANGTPDASFGQGGTAITALSADAYARSVAIQPDGKILVAGPISTADGGSDLFVLRLLTNGSLDPSFGMNGKFILNIPGDAGQIGSITTDAARAIVVLPDDRIVISGISDQTISAGTQVQSKAVLLRLTADGVLDTTFASGGISTLLLETRNTTNQPLRSNIMAAKPRANGGLLARVNVNREIAAGIFQPWAYLIGFNADGTLDSAFGHNGVVDLIVERGNFGSAATLDLLELKSGKIICSTEPGLTGLNSDGTLDRGFGSNGNVRFTTGLYTNSMLLEMPDGTFAVSGTNRFGQQNSNKYVGEVRRFLPTGELDARFGSAGHVYLSSSGRDVVTGMMKLNPVGSLTVIGNRSDNTGIPYLFSAHVSITRKL